MCGSPDNFHGIFDGCVRLVGYVGLHVVSHYNGTHNETAEVRAGMEGGGGGGGGAKERVGEDEERAGRRGGGRERRSGANEEGREGDKVRQTKV